MIDQIKESIIKANVAYRSGNSIISDFDYDQLVDNLSLLSPDDELLVQIGHVVIDESRKVKLPIDMASMNKTKSLEGILNWIRLKKILKCARLVITPKFDGLSLCVNEKTKECYTRGGGVYGQRSNEHYKLISNKLKESNFDFTYGEIIMSKKKFNDKYSKDFANPRNFVAGLLNSPDARESLRDCDYIKYGAVGYEGYDFKSDILNELNKNQDIKVNYHTCSIDDLSEEFLIELFHKWSIDYEIDGLIIEVDHLGIQEQLGRENSSNNPVFARAFKHPSFEQTDESDVIGVSWNISKQGLLKPIIHINPIKLDGVIVSNVTGNNARFMRDNGIGIGSRVIVKRSGMVIPIIVDVIKKVDFILPVIDGGIEWNDAGIELITLTETDDQKLRMNIAFFQILEADNVSEGVITQLWDAGYKTIKEILNLTISDLLKIDRFGKRKSKIVYDSIQKSVSGVSLSKLQHATGIFRGLGSKKLILLEEFKTKPTIDQVMSIDGFAEKSAKSYVDNYDTFFDFIKDLPIKIEEKVESVKVGTDLDENNFVFSGVRRKDLEEIIESRGGKIGGSVSKNTTHLIMKVTGSGSSKENKAIKLGVTIMTVDQLEILLK